ncbi:hypothetical protein [Jeotgalibacillus campisalis]|uniref:DUF4367 domain-containing protein n=1 Tax=Jeotgalibacillus campisalis TaxID=220754 RepID=A0A0C2V2B0_9BACL|nr:hypothetical protein [Jeotgalibacillus campisalis]KIL43187.1 hypothetical protein KR50_35900 [Jeotgalibacillus campisalis]
MKLIPVVFLLFFGLAISSYLTTNANSDDPEKSFRDALKNDGFVTLEKAVEQFEKKVEENIILPDIPFDANIKVGKITTEGSLNLKWISTNEIDTRTLWMDVVPIKKELKLNPEKWEILELPNGVKAYYDDNHYYELVLQKGSFHYFINHDKENITKEDFIKMVKRYQ